MLISFQGRRRQGFTLLEMMITLALASLVYTLVTMVTVQMSRTVTQAEGKAELRNEVIRVAEQMRWQLRLLYATSNTSDEKPVNNTYPGVYQMPLYAKRGSEADCDILLFGTAARPQGQSLTFMSDCIEVNYTIKKDQEGKKYLAYRQYPWIDPLGLHDPNVDDPKVPWKVLSRHITGLELGFSTDSETWSHEWLEGGVPKYVRITLYMSNDKDKRNPLIFEVLPAMESKRW